MVMRAASLQVNYMERINSSLARYRDECIISVLDAVTHAKS